MINGQKAWKIKNYNSADQINPKVQFSIFHCSHSRTKTFNNKTIAIINVKLANSLTRVLNQTSTSITNNGQKHTKHYRVSCKNVYSTLKVNIQHFLSTKIIKNIQMSVILIITSFFHK